MRRLILAVALVALAAVQAVAGPRDQQIAEQLAQSLKTSGTLKGYAIAVKYRDGTARLDGWVRNRQQMEEAVRIIQRSPQVERVINRLAIRETPGTPPAALKTQGAQASPRPLLRQVGYPRTRSAVHRTGAYQQQAQGMPVPEYRPVGTGPAPAIYDHPNLPPYAWPTYAAYPNYAALTYPKQYSPTAWPYIGPFYPYPQVPLGWRKVTLEWDDGWWFLDFSDDRRHVLPR